MDASSVKTPESQEPADNLVETAGEGSASFPRKPTGDVVLLVEDNAINMRVSFSFGNSHALFRTTFLLEL
jgi:hypothetical protein